VRARLRPVFAAVAFVFSREVSAQNATLTAPWQTTPGPANTTQTAQHPPAPPGANQSPAGPQQGGAARAAAPSTSTQVGERVQFESDDTPVDVFVVTGTREVMQVVNVPVASPMMMSSFGPVGPFGPTSPYAPFGSSTLAPGDVFEARTTVEQRRFLCRTPCAVQLPEGTLSLHLRTLGASLGTESATIPRGGARFRVRTSSAGLYTIGQAMLWVGAGLAITGVTLLVQSQTGCGSRGCTPWPGIVVTAGGLLSMAIGTPLVALHSRRLQSLGLQSLALGLGTVAARF